MTHRDNTFNIDCPTQGLQCRRTRLFFPSDGCDHRQSSLRLLTEGRVNPTGLTVQDIDNVDVDTDTVYPRTVTHHSTNRARRSATAMIVAKVKCQMSNVNLYSPFT